MKLNKKIIAVLFYVVASFSATIVSTASVIYKDIAKNKFFAVPYDTFTSLVNKDGKTVRSFDKIQK